MTDDWREHAACQHHRHLDWFPHEANIAAVTACKAICATCPVRSACLRDAEASDEGEAGIRGGLTETERRRRPGRPVLTVDLAAGMAGVLAMIREYQLTGVLPSDQLCPVVELSDRACGTAAGYQRHRRAGEVTCQACRDAHAADKTWRRRRKEMA